MIPTFQGIKRGFTFAAFLAARLQSYDLGFTNRMHAHENLHEKNKEEAGAEQNPVFLVWEAAEFFCFLELVGEVPSISIVGSSVCAQRGQKQGHHQSSSVVQLVLPLLPCLQASGLLKIQ